MTEQLNKEQCFTLGRSSVSLSELKGNVFVVSLVFILPSTNTKIPSMISEKRYLLSVQLWLDFPSDSMDWASKKGSSATHLRKWAWCFTFCYLCSPLYPDKSRYEMQSVQSCSLTSAIYRHKSCMSCLVGKKQVWNIYVLWTSIVSCESKLGWEKKKYFKELEAGNCSNLLCYLMSFPIWNFTCPSSQSVGINPFCSGKMLTTTFFGLPKGKIDQEFMNLLLKTFSLLSSMRQIQVTQYKLLPYKSRISWGYVWPQPVLFLTCVKVNFEESEVNQRRGDGRAETQPSFSVSFMEVTELHTS